MPLVLLSVTSMLCLGLIVHRQWTRRERLRYPIADFTTTMISGRTPEGQAPLFRHKLFWIGLAIVLGIHVINGIQAWHPDSIRIPLTFDFTPIGQKFPAISSAPWSWSMMRFRLYPTVIAFSFFLVSDITLSLGLTQFLALPIGVWLISMGVDIRSGYMSGGGTGWQRFGSYFAFALMLLYIGRRYYWRLLKRTLFFGRDSQDVAPYEARAARVLLLAMGAMIAMIVSLGLDWPLAVLTVAMMMMTFVMVSRISAETGLFFIQPRWQAMGVLLGLLGGYALGAEAIIIVGLLCTVLSIDPSQAVMPYFVNALKTCEDLAVRPARLAVASMGTYGLGVAVAIVAVLWANYNFGIARQNFITRRVPTMPFRAAGKVVDELKAADRLDASLRLGPVERFTNLQPERKFLWAAGIGFVLVVAFSWMRLRFSWWPLHPDGW